MSDFYQYFEQFCNCDGFIYIKTRHKTVSSNQRDCSVAVLEAGPAAFAAADFG
jgi:hypothetical protein